MLTSVSFSVFTLIQQELMGWHPSGVKRTKVWVIGVYFSNILFKKKKFSSSKWGIRVFQVPVNWVKMTGKWGEIQGWKSDLVQVSEEIRLSVFELSGLYCIVVFYPCRWFTWSWHLRWYSSCCRWCCSSSGNGICKSQVNLWVSLVYYHDCNKPKKIELDFTRKICIR